MKFRASSLQMESAARSVSACDRLWPASRVCAFPGVLWGAQKCPHHAVTAVACGPARSQFTLDVPIGPPRSVCVFKLLVTFLLLSRHRR